MKRRLIRALLRHIKDEHLKAALSERGYATDISIKFWSNADNTAKELDGIGKVKP